MKINIKYVELYISFLAIEDSAQNCTLREKCSYSELFWSVFSGIWNEYG